MPRQGIHLHSRRRPILTSENLSARRWNHWLGKREKKKKKKGRKSSKKEKRKRRTKAAKALQYELFGLLFIFLSIFGSGASLISEGFIPTGLENAFRFFLGIWYFVASIILFIIGIYFVLKRKPIRLFT